MLRDIRQSETTPGDIVGVNAEYPNEDDFYGVAIPHHISLDSSSFFNAAPKTVDVIVIYHHQGSSVINLQAEIEKLDRTSEEVIPEEVLSDLADLERQAKEQDLPVPDPACIENAKELLPRLSNILAVRYLLEPTERRGVSISAPMKWGRSVSVECAPNDVVYCFVAIDGKARRAKFFQMDGLPDVFIREALLDLDR